MGPITVLYHPAGGKSATRLACFMGIERRQHIRANQDNARPKFLIRYGSARGVAYKAAGRTLNPRWAISGASDRLDQLTRLETLGISVPKFWGGGENAEAIPHGFPLIGRDRAQGKQGKDIVLYPDGLPNPEIPLRHPAHSLWTEYVSKKRQFRVSVVGTRTRVRELLGGDMEQPVWNHGTGFRYMVGEPYSHEVRAWAILAVRALGLDFGAVDIIEGNHPSGHFVLEVNTAPGLCDATLEWYAQELGYLVGLTPSDMPGWDAPNLKRQEA